MTPAQDLEGLYDEHAQAIFAFLINLTRNEADTRDLVQEVFVKLVRQPDLLPVMRHPRAFLLRLAHNAALDLIRRTGVRERVGAEWTGADPSLFAPANDPDQETFRRTLAVALAELPPEQRAVVHLKLWEGLTFETIATTLEIPLHTAASRYRYALDKLRRRLRPLYDEIKTL